jgi:hypothetical protein
MLVIKNGYFTFNGKIFGGILKNNKAVITNQNATFGDIMNCKKALINKGYEVEIAI